MFDYSELYFCSRNFSSYMPPPPAKNRIYSKYLINFGLMWRFLLFFSLETSPQFSAHKLSFPPWQVAESRLKTESTWLSRLGFPHSGKLPGFHLTHYYVLWRPFGFWLFRVFIHSLNFTLFTHFLFIQQVFNELPWDTRSCSKSQEWSRGPDNKFLLLRNWCSLKVALYLNPSKLGLPE